MTSATAWMANRKDGWSFDTYKRYRRALYRLDMYRRETIAGELHCHNNFFFYYDADVSYIKLRATTKRYSMNFTQKSVANAARVRLIITSRAARTSCCLSQKMAAPLQTISQWIMCLPTQRESEKISGGKTQRKSTPTGYRNCWRFFMLGACAALLCIGAGRFGSGETAAVTGAADWTRSSHPAQQSFGGDGQRIFGRDRTAVLQRAAANDVQFCVPAVFSVP